jgi:hypothetical protein
MGVATGIRARTGGLIVRLARATMASCQPGGRPSGGTATVP